MYLIVISELSPRNIKKYIFNIINKITVIIKEKVVKIKASNAHDHREIIYTLDDKVIKIIAFKYKIKNNYKKYNLLI